MTNDEIGCNIYIFEVLNFASKKVILHLLVTMLGFNESHIVAPYTDTEFEISR